MSLMVETESGSVYEFTDDMRRVRRKAGQGASALRKDGEWLDCDEPVVQVSDKMRLRINSLVDPPGFTLRTTTPVVAIWQMDDSMSE